MANCIILIEDYKSINFQVSDNAESVLSTSCEVVIDLIDVDQNINSPEFDDVAHEASVYGRFIGFLRINNQRFYRK